MDDLWIYDCYVSEDATSPGGYPRSPSTASHSRSISLPSTTTGLSPVTSVPVVKEPSPSIIKAAPFAPASRDTQRAPVGASSDGAKGPKSSPSALAYESVDPIDPVLPQIITSVFSPSSMMRAAERPPEAALM